MQRNITHIETTDAVKEALSILKTITDPEIPVISITDLGIVRDILYEEDNRKLTVIITPTYSGCPAMDLISMNIRMALQEAGFQQPEIKTVLSPAWTTDWMSEEGKQQLKAYGIAPPNPRQQVCNPEMFARDEVVQCPRCNSFHTTMISRFGSTACKSLYRCEDCKEPFDYFKCH